ncbi:hypothetical protein IJJ53_00505 [Candidatus Saccharibacteria bacterium]|nr:hypothetical protein [Candidatus Saccharibacteria bacterium]
MKIRANRNIKIGIEEPNDKLEDGTTFFYYAFRNILLVGLPLVLVSGFVLSHLSFSSSATSGSGSSADSLNISISSSCTLGSVVNNAHNTEVFNGNYKDNIGKTTITTLCNDNNGYAIYAIGYTNNEEGNNKLINSSSPQNSIGTGLATSGLTSAWAMRLDYIENDPSPTPPTSIASSYNATYGLVPPYYTKVVEKASGTTDMSQGSSFTTTYAVYASSNQYAGTYTGQVKYLLTHAAYRPTTFYMQDVANWKDEQIPNVGDTILAVDQRDYKPYYVTRLSDDHIWMTQNLDFDLDNTKTLSSLDTDLNVIYNNGQYAEYGSGYSQANDVIYWKPDNSTINFTGTKLNGWINSNSMPYSASKTDDINTGHASLGNYYNWTAAIASNDSSTFTSHTISNISQNPKNSICPKGWRLPTVSNQSGANSGSTNEFARFNNLYDNVFENPLYFIEAGYVSGSSLIETSSDGNGVYVSSTSYSNDSVYGAGVSSSAAKFRIDWWRTGYSGRSGGWSVRCLAR